MAKRKTAAESCKEKGYKRKPGRPAKPKKRRKPGRPKLKTSCARRGFKRGPGRPKKVKLRLTADQMRQLLQ